jgi:uncharacterized protein (UPF0305 family)
MSSLTPKHREAEAVAEATNEGFFNGLLVLIPSVAAVGLALRHSPAFALRTNWQSRTAMAVMPAFFVTALTGEQRLSQRMREIASESQHHSETVVWAEKELRKQREQQRQQQQSWTDPSNKTETEHLAALYNQSVRESGVCVVDELHWYHKAANYTGQNPIKVLAAVAVPAVGFIFYGRTEQSHLALASKLMHTRVIGQFATVSLLLGIMGFKEFMDRNGRFISRQQAQERVEEMQGMRMQLLQTLERERQDAAQRKKALAEAHEQDVQERRTAASITTLQHAGVHKGNAHVSN